MSQPDGSLLVLGIGNTLLGDEGVGVHVVREMGRLAERGDVVLPAGTALLDGGTLGPGLLPWIAGARAVVLVDAAELDAEPGSVAVFRGDALRTARGTAAARPAGVGSLLGAARLADVLPAAVALVGIQPADVEVGLELSEPARAALPAAIEATLTELQRVAACGSPPTPGPGASREDAAGAGA
jgi:hydrogenase maturation protease